MARCRSWRPNPNSHHPVGHRPGGCRTCWKPCLNPVGRGETRCEDCLYALADHHDPQVRQALLEESPPVEVLQLLSSDLDPLVQRTAAFRLRSTSEGVPPW